MINCVVRKSNLEYIKNTSLEPTKRGRLEGKGDNFLEQSKDHQHMFIAGDILAGAVHNEPAAAISGKRIAKYIHARMNGFTDQLEKLRNFDYKYMPYCLFTSPEIGGVGLTEAKASQVYKSGQVMPITLKKTAYLDKLEQMFEVQKIKKVNLIKILFEEKSRMVLGLHYLGMNAGEVIQGYSVSSNFILLRLFLLFHSIFSVF